MKTYYLYEKKTIKYKGKADLPDAASLVETQDNGVTVVTPPTFSAAQAIIFDPIQLTWNLIEDTEGLVDEKNKALKIVDEQVGYIRSKYITTTPGQSEIYTEKLRQAITLVENNYVLDGSFPSSLVQVDTVVYNITIQQAADNIIAKYNEWLALAVQLETIRLGVKKVIENAESKEQINLELDQLDEQLSNF